MSEITVNCEDILSTTCTENRIETKSAKTNKANWFKSKTNDGSTVPLHAGSKVFISKTDLLNINSNKPFIYIEQLANTLFGKELLASATLSKYRSKGDKNLEFDCREKLYSLISKII